MADDHGRERLELLVLEEDGKTRLRSPEVGLFTRALPAGTLVGAGTVVGVLDTLGRARELVVPAGVTGRIASERPERVHRPVGWGATLYELDPIDAGTGAGTADAQRAGDGGAVVSAPYSGRFWHRPTPKDPPFVADGDVIEAGQTIGLVEVMKTFTHLAYSASGGLPERARVVRVVAGDGDEVAEGDPLLEVRPA